ncbi:DnaJ C-terminal domain-containing protein [Arthrobacter sp. Rue61a]|uniref:DnaJ domain protein n=1 Tax=Paenarthrobacter aurescens (strain TC1) TaxID=290340 RepID=A1R5W5_PAEAT|nr:MULTISPECIES: DnaJ C-terminal domain-containing protein [Micrococcaceae]ABM06979.1 putative DnaJ domain protein [Paenarthrobacter aurescens TC1]AFR28915.1 chaperone protein DnaJ [Arthrobacter sp. Rue61a]
MAKDHYSVLGVPRTAKPDAIQRAYRKLARKYHPDVNREPDAADKFKEIGEAYDTLSDPETRARYDRFGADYRQYAGSGADSEAGGAGWGSGGPRPGPRPGRGPYGGAHVDMGGDVDWEDLLGGWFRQHGAGPAPGSDHEAELRLTLEEAIRGGRRTVRLAEPGGETRNYDVDVPPGVVDGQRIRLAGEGAGGRDGGRPGDLFLTVSIQPDARYRLKGRDIHFDLPVTPSEAALGARIKVNAPGGPVTMTVPEGSSSGRRLRLRGQGLPDPKGQPGNLYAEIRVMVPPRLSNEVRKIYEQLAAVSDFHPREGLL